MSMNPGDLGGGSGGINEWIQDHKGATIGIGAGALVLFYLYMKKKSASAASSSTNDGSKSFISQVNRSINTGTRVGELRTANRRLAFDQQRYNNPRPVPPKPPKPVPEPKPKPSPKKTAETAVELAAL